MFRLHESVSGSSFAFVQAPHIAMAPKGKRLHQPAAASASSHEPAATAAAASSHELPATDAEVAELWRPFDPEIDCVFTAAGHCCTTWEIQTESLVGARWKRLVVKQLAKGSQLAAKAALAETESAETESAESESAESESTSFWV